MANFRGRAFSSIFSSDVSDEISKDNKSPGSGSSKQDNLTLLPDEESIKKNANLEEEKNEKEKLTENINTENEMLKNEKQEWEAEKQKFEEENNKKCSLIEELENQIKIKENTVVELELNIHEIELQLDNSSDQLKEQLEIKETRVSELVKEIELLTSENEDLKKELDDLENKQSDIDDDVLEAIEIEIDQVSSVQNELLKAENKIQLLEDELEVSRKEYATLENFINKLGLDGGAGELKKAQKTIQQLAYIIEKQKVFINEREEYISKIKIGIRETTEQLLNENTPQFLEVTTENLPILEDFITIKEQEKVMSKIISHMQFMEDNFIRKLEEEKAIKKELEFEKINLLEKVDQIIKNFETSEASISIATPTAIDSLNEISDQSKAKEDEKPLNSKKNNENERRIEVVEKTKGAETGAEDAIVRINENETNNGVISEDTIICEIYEKIANEELDDYREAFNKEFTIDEVKEIVKTTIEAIPIKKLKGESLNPEDRRLNGKFKEYRELLAVTA